MTTLEAVENAEAPGVGEIDMTDPMTWVALVGGAFAVVTAFSVANFGFEQVKSFLGTNDLQVPSVGDV